MATITKEAVNRINAKAFNGFRLDIQKAVVWNDKTLIKQIAQENDKFIRVIIEYDHAENGNIPVIYVQEWEHETGLLYRNGRSIYYEIAGVNEKTRKVDTLCKLSEKINDNLIAELIAGLNKAEHDTSVFSTRNRKVINLQ